MTVLGYLLFLRQVNRRMTIAYFVDGQITTSEYVQRFNTLSRLYRAIR